MTEYAFCTVVTRSHLRYAVGLGMQLKRFHPETTLHILLIDPPSDLTPFDRYPVSLVPMSEVRIPDIDAMKIYFNAFELSNALKPFMITHLLDRGFRRVIYLDSDILVVGRFDTLISLLDHANFVLTPHILTPSLDNVDLPTYIHVADLGIYNGGVWGISEHENARAALTWLMDVLPEAGFHDHKRGMFVDQKLLPLAADLFSVGFKVFRNPGYNVANWNLQERDVRKIDGRYFVGDVPVTFFHLSGFREENPERFSASNKNTISTIPVIADIIADYLASLPWDPCLAPTAYPFATHKGRRLTFAQRRYFFEKRTFAGYRMARTREIAGKIYRGVKRLLLRKQ